MRHSAEINAILCAFRIPLHGVKGVVLREDRGSPSLKATTLAACPLEPNSSTTFGSHIVKGHGSFYIYFTKAPFTKAGASGNYIVKHFLSQIIQHLFIYQMLLFKAMHN